MRTVGLGLLLFLALTGWCSAGETFTGAVVGITDGDTLRVMRAGTAVKIRLHGIDAPEKGQAFGMAAKQSLSDLTFEQTVTVAIEATDRYGRFIAQVVLADGRVVSQEQVRLGMAWWYQQYAPHDAALATLEALARSEKVGLWVDPSPIPPWVWRQERLAPAK